VFVGLLAVSRYGSLCVLPHLVAFYYGKYIIILYYLDGVAVFVIGCQRDGYENLIDLFGCSRNELDPRPGLAG
jgi:hypothetical protein